MEGPEPRRTSREHRERLERNPVHLQMLEGRRRAAEEEERARWRRHLSSIAQLVFWAVLACALVAWGMTTSRVEYSRTAMEAGILIGYAGIFYTLLRAFQRRE